MAEVYDILIKEMLRCWLVTGLCATISIQVQYLFLVFFLIVCCHGNRKKSKYVVSRVKISQAYN